MSIGNPNSCEWGDICWGHYTSRDGIHWAHNGDQPALEPSTSYDEKGIFTGCFYPSGLHGETGQLTVFYSSIRNLPIHWTIPYTRNCAGLAVATSDDAGRTWQKSVFSPILEGEPEGLAVTGFRDPYLAEWEAMDGLRGEKSLYGIISGGISSKGPNAFLYSVAPDNLTKWAYLGPLCDIPSSAKRPSKWKTNFGVNWECVNFMTLESETTRLEFLILGAEGHQGKLPQDKDTDSNAVSTLWMAGGLKSTPTGPILGHQMSGVLDSGSFYAAASYRHPTDGKRIVWGWIKEEELTLARREKKGWTGYMSLPRELFLYEKPNIVGTLQTPLHDIPALQLTGQPNGTSIVRTLGTRPLDCLQTLRNGRPQTWSQIPGNYTSFPLKSSAATNWELEATINVTGNHYRVGFHILHNTTMSQRTTMSFSPRDETIELDKRLSNSEKDICKDPATGSFTLFRVRENETETIEKLHLRIFRDGDVLEVFANDRFALSTTVYVDGAICNGITAFWDGTGRNDVVFESISLWEELGSVLEGPA
jgi:beta-fructofuranosidase